MEDTKERTYNEEELLNIATALVIVGFIISVFTIIYLII